MTVARPTAILDNVPPDSPEPIIEAVDVVKTYDTGRVQAQAIVWGDEPTGDLDSQNATEIMDLLSDLNQKHSQTFVLVTHDQGIAQRTERIIRMQDGQIVSDQRLISREAGVWGAAAGS